MNKKTRLAAVLAFAATCTLSALAQDTGVTGATHGNTAEAAAQAAPGTSHTISASQTGSAAAPDTRGMGAGPQDPDRGDRRGFDIGWVGLLGLAGLLGLRGHRRGRTGPERPANG